MEDSFNKKTIYNDKIKPLIRKIRLICDEYQVPMFMTFAVENSQKGTKYETEMHSGAACDTVLTNDRLVKHALVMKDFEVVPSFSEPVYEEDLEESNEEDNFDL